MINAVSDWWKKVSNFITTVSFYPRPVLAFRYCRCLYLVVTLTVRLSIGVCVNHEYVCAMTGDPFKLVSPNLDQRCKPHGYNPYRFGGDWPWPRSNFTWKSILPHFELVCMISCQSFELESPNLDQKCILVQLRSLFIWGLVNPWATNSFFNHETYFSAELGFSTP